MFSKLRLRNYRKDITDVLRECLHSRTKAQDILLLAAERSWNEVTDKFEYEPKNPQALRVAVDGAHCQKHLFSKSLFKEAKKIHEEIGIENDDQNLKKLMRFATVIKSARSMPTIQICAIRPRVD